MLRRRIRDHGEKVSNSEGSTNWPHCNIFGQGKVMRNGAICSGERFEPLKKPELTDTVLKLAGVEPYQNVGRELRS